MLPIHTILLPTDFSDCSEYARQLARAIARDYEARLVVLHVAPSEIIHGGLVDGPDEVRTRLDDLEARLRNIFAEGLTSRIEVHVLEGDEVEAILCLADEVDADLIVMGTAGRSGLGRFFLGSVAEDVMRKARCPVLTVRGPARVAVPRVRSLIGSEA